MVNDAKPTLGTEITRAASCSNWPFTCGQESDRSSDRKGEFSPVSMELSQAFENIAVASGSKSGSIPVLPVIDTAINLVIDISELPISAAIMTSFEPDAIFCPQQFRGNYIPCKRKEL